MTDEELKNLVSKVQPIWQGMNMTPGLKSYINESILRRLRNLDYFGRQKLLLLMSGLLSEQQDSLQEPLFGLVSVIDQIEKEIKEEDFDQKLEDAVFGLSREEQKQLLKDLEQKKQA